MKSYLICSWSPLASILLSDRWHHFLSWWRGHSSHRGSSAPYSRHSLVRDWITLTLCLKVEKMKSRGFMKGLSAKCLPFESIRLKSKNCSHGLLHTASYWWLKSLGRSDVMLRWEIPGQGISGCCISPRSFYQVPLNEKWKSIPEKKIH